MTSELVMLSIEIFWKLLSLSFGPSSESWNLNGLKFGWLRWKSSLNHCNPERIKTLASGSRRSLMMVWKAGCCCLLLAHYEKWREVQHIPSVQLHLCTRRFCKASMGKLTLKAGFGQRGGVIRYWRRRGEYSISYVCWILLPIYSQLAPAVFRIALAIYSMWHRTKEIHRQLGNIRGRGKEPLLTFSLVFYSLCSWHLLPHNGM